ncbi:cystatin-like fold lipoprotein [Staphylococcus schweitzeri]|uniref:Lipoprotein n=1 Tax=Staphylococcus schweitzeri TaxID=1654388 RepID=A0A2K4AIF7_9STAP|nr:DUF4467 domain-containing protein [Staphylococcus schweitzeri]MBE2127611.1 DUF4467 domain-containing protein [Staphylococcus schweitzeri]PNZ49911.1 cystatin-like fold lipoprotein [Staphylococcus schweitzeri]CDR27175.1 lipoprotein [Staphylococcus schweitzeri]CDR53163.1 lipoprotein [Staphylococcus schweitzeri]VEE64878.1 Uncharacterised protein [Staphylococcus schweitzeri]
MKRILIVFLMLAIVLAGCSNKGEKYQKDIDKVYKEQKQMNKDASKIQNTIKTDIKQEDSNTHVYKDGKVIVIGIQLFKDQKKMYYFAYDIKDGKAKINKEIDPIKYMKDHKADFEDENVEVKKD